jgi:5-(carboxyamino)imidazole ribonucleotide synthase
VPYARLESAADLAALQGSSGDHLFPAILKTSTLGYDGKGQARVERVADLAAAWAGLGTVPCLLEKRVALSAELSVVVARDATGPEVHLPVQQNLHRDGILAVTVVPAPEVHADLAAQAVQRASAVAESLGYVGVLCVEFFLLTDGTLLANEMAPRPHNSGHHSIDACDVSQFDLQVRAMAGLPLVMPRQHSPAVMLNLLGDLWFAQGASMPEPPPWSAVLALPGTHLHLYGKTEPRRGRKMGHLTVTAARAEDARSVALQAAALLGLEPF